MPRLLNYIVAIYLIVVGLLGLFPHRLEPARASTASSRRARRHRIGMPACLKLLRGVRQSRHCPWPAFRYVPNDGLRRDIPMADHTPTGPVELGAKMDYAEHDTHLSPLSDLAKYGSLVCAALLVAMAFGFFTTAGFFSATRAVHPHLRGRRLHSPLDCSRSLPQAVAAAAGGARPKQRSSRKGSAVGQTVFMPTEIDAERAARGGIAGHGEADGGAWLRRDRRGAAPALLSRIADEDFAKAGRRDRQRPRMPARADVVLKVRRPSDGRARRLQGAARPSSPSWIPTATTRRSQRWPRPASPAFAMEFMPRITRAQSMDVLSSQANLAGYQAVIDGGRRI